MKHVQITGVLVLGLGLALTLLWLVSGSAATATAAPECRPRQAPGDAVTDSVRATKETLGRDRVSRALLSLPLRFIVNVGQTEPAVRFTVKGAGHTLFFTEEEVVFSALQEIEDEAQAGSEHPVGHSKKHSVVRLRFLGANSHPTIEGLAPMPGVVNFFLGSDPARWQANVSTYGAVIYRDLYPGIDLIYRGTEGYLKSEFVVAPGADPAAIQMVYSGVEVLRLREDGALVLQTSLGELIETAPLIYQEIDGVRPEISGGYVLLDSSKERGDDDTFRVGFQIAAYDATLPLVVDPTLRYATYLGGGDADGGQSIAVDSEGNAYVTGLTSSSDFPTTTNAIQLSYGGGNYDAFVTQIVQVGKVYTYGYSTYLGGSGDDYGTGIAVDGAGNAYIAGETRSSDFPTTTNAIQANFGGGTADAFVIKIVSAGEAYTLAYSSFLGGSGLDRASDIALSSAGDVYVMGWAGSVNFPTTTNAIQPGWAGAADVFVTQIISAAGFYTYGYSSYLGGIGSDQGHSIAVDDSGNAYVTGVTASSDFPTQNAIQSNFGGGSYDAFATHIISVSGFYTYGYSTFLGGGGFDFGQGIAVDRDGNAFVAGYTRSSDFPTHNALQATHANTDTNDAFVTHIISASGVYTYGYSTYLGGDDDDAGRDIAVDGAGNAYVTGETMYPSNGFPVHNAIQAGNAGSYDAFVTHIISASGTYTYGYSTFLGGGLDDRGYGITADGGGNVYLTGWSYSTDFPTPNGINTTRAGNRDAFVAKIGFWRLYLPIVMHNAP